VPVALFLSVFLIAACGLIYELIAGTLASYLLGDSVFQFSTIIGCYLFAMGIGSYLSRFLRRGLVARFVSIELMVGLVGGFSSSLLFLAFAYTEAFRLVLYVVVILVGTLVGLEIPLLMRILKERFQFRDLISHVLTFDYLGALGASLLFPILLVPKLGLVRSALVFGILNAGVALWSTFIFRDQLPASRALRAGCIAVLVFLGAGTAFADRISSAADNSLYAAKLDTSVSYSPSGRTISGCFSTRICNSARATNTAITKLWCIPAWPRFPALEACSCWAAATDSPSGKS